MAMTARSRPRVRPRPASPPARTKAPQDLTAYSLRKIRREIRELQHAVITLDQQHRILLQAIARRRK